MSTTLERTARTAPDIAGGWLRDFAAALDDRDARAAARLFQPDGWWRDLLAFTWDLSTVQGSDAVAARLDETLTATAPSGFALHKGKEPVLVDGGPGATWVQAFYTFRTAAGRGRGFLRLTPDGDGWRAWTVLTALEELHGHERAAGATRPHGTVHGEHRGHANWLDERTAEREYADRDPTVVVVGAGQAGLSLAARLGQLGVDTLLVERNARIGDSWRNRYHSLVLHDPVWYDHLPYLPFPSHWPVFTPKDKLAGWFESYAESMELNVWTGTSFDGGTYDEATGRWSVTLTRPDGTTRELHPSHLVLATGMSGVPKQPNLAGADVFGGTVVHSSMHKGGAEWAGRSALVVGCCNSGHDIAQELSEHGADTTMLQRSSTYVMSSENGIAVLFAGLYEEGGPPTEDADLIFASIPYAQLAQLHKDATREIARRDADLLAGLERAGFTLDYGDDGSGLFMKYLQRGGGYYIDVGCSSLIANGKIAVKQGVEVDHLTEDSVVFTDGTSQPADLVVLATGYENMRESARALLGDSVADRCTPVWGLDDSGELRTIWRRSGHPGFWFMGGNLHQSRHYSQFLALQITAVEDGLIPR